MSNILTLDDIDEQIRPQVYNQDYSPASEIDGVQVIKLKHVISDEGDFAEVMRLNDKGELDQIPGFRIAQINRTRLFPNSIKAWHVHFKQDEAWYVPRSYQLFVGLWDLRKKSVTNKKIMRINLGGGNSALLFIPKGVAHGSMNLSSQPVELFYFVNQQFNPQDPDEKRIHWDAAGKEFWTPERD
ncbi:MAG: dTDP-4-dehydrorhamnose 3,5-epimerase family protein [Patescibacteria group bacterium]